MEYESDILKRLIKTYGVVGNPRYISEIIKEFIVQGKECYPNLFTYQADWLAHIDEFGLTPDYVVSYTGQHIYAPNTKEKPVKSAILSGSTKYRDVDTGEFLETFEEGRNLELVSVKMPVLTMTGKNLFDKTTVVKGVTLSATTGAEALSDKRFTSGFIFVKNMKNITINVSSTILVKNLWGYDANKIPIKKILSNEFSNKKTIAIPDNVYYIKMPFGHVDDVIITDDIISSINIQIEEGLTATLYEPYKSNILTVNEDVTLRSNGSVYDELDLLTGKLTQRIDEDGEVLAKEVIKTVDLTIHDKDQQKVERLSSFDGGTHFTTSSQEGSLLPTLTVDVVTDLEETLRVCSLDGNTM